MMYMCLIAAAGQVQLLKENIYRNFPQLTGVVVFIDGKVAFEQL